MALGKMFPALPIDDKTHTGIRNAELGNEIFERRTSLTKFPHFDDLLGLQFAVDALARGLSILANLIRRVFLIGSQKQVVRPHAFGLITIVADTHPLGNWPIGQFPCESMGRNLAAGVAQSECAISVAATRPVPTTTTPSNKPPEPFHASKLVPIRATSRANT